MVDTPDPQLPARRVMPLLPGEGGVLADYDPDELSEELTAAFEASLAKFREARGVVRAPEDTHQVIRAVHAVASRASDFAKVFTRLAKRAGQVIDEELVEAVGADQAGVPLRAMSVPHAGTKIRLAPEYENNRTIDRTTAITGVLALIADQWVATGRETTMDPHGFALEVAERAALLFGSDPKVQISQLDALVMELGQRDMDSVASVTRGAIVSEKREFKKVSVEQSIPKPRKPRGESAA
jgi:hypothetical protein